MSTNTNTVEINRGEDKVLNLRIRDENQDPKDLTGIEDAEACFVGETSPVIKTLGSGVTVSGDPILGRLEITLTEAETALLKVGTNQDFKLTIVFPGTETKIKKVSRAINVVDPTC